MRRGLLLSLALALVLGQGLGVVEARPRGDLGTPTVPPPTSMPTDVPVTPTRAPISPTSAPGGSPTAVAPTSAPGGSPTVVVPTSGPGTPGPTRVSGTPAPTRPPRQDPDPTEEPTTPAIPLPTATPFDSGLGTPLPTEVPTEAPSQEPKATPSQGPTAVPTGVGQHIPAPTGASVSTPSPAPRQPTPVPSARVPRRLPITAQEDGVPVVMLAASLSPLVWVALVALLLGVIGALLVVLARRGRPQATPAGAAPAPVMEVRAVATQPQLAARPALTLPVQPAVPLVALKPGGPPQPLPPRRKREEI